MNLGKRIAAGVVTLAVATGISACGGDTSWVYQSGDATITAGMYIGLSIQASQNAYNVEGVDSAKDIFDQQLNGKDPVEWLKEETERLSKEYLAVENKFAEKNLSFSEDDQAMLDAQVNSYWSYMQAYYEGEGCGEVSFTSIMTNSMKKSLLFEAIYGEGGEQAVSDADLKVYFYKDFLKTTYITVPLTDESGTKLTDDALKAKQDEAKDLAEQVKKGGDIEEIKATYEKSEETEESTDTTASDEKAETSVIIFRDSSAPEKLKTALFDAKVGDSGMVEDDTAAYVYYKQDLEKDPTAFDEYKGDILSNLKGEEFEESVKTWSNEVSLTKNDAALRKYNPKNLK